MSGHALKKTGTIFLSLLGLTAIIVIHEFGHFTACKLFNVRTSTFSIGFDPAIVSHNIGETKFQIGAIPLGGYVLYSNFDFNNLPFGKKIVIILAGILFNFLLTFFIFWYLYLQNKQKYSVELQESSGEEPKKPRSKIIEFLARSTPPEAREILSKMKTDGFVGPIGIISLLGQSIEKGVDIFLYFLAIISLNIGIFNLFPIPFLDGGHALQVIIESSMGSLPSRPLKTIYYIFFLLMLLFTLVLAFKDVIRIRNKSKDKAD